MLTISNRHISGNVITGNTSAARHSRSLALAPHDSVKFGIGPGNLKDKYPDLAKLAEQRRQLEIKMEEAKTSLQRLMEIGSEIQELDRQLKHRVSVLPKQEAKALLNELFNGNPPIEIQQSGPDHDLH